jgi:hypothetical protein|tara:strand:- start:200 stop:1084 length:885 start_codon:yes stop_codon:yes gene_type:complete
MVTPVVTNVGEDPIVTGKESSLSNYVGPYVTEMLGKGAALANEGYNAYMGPLTAGESGLQTQAFEGLGSLALPTDDMGVGGYQPQQFTGDIAQQYMNPYLQASLDPQIAAARRQSEIDRVNNASRMTKANTFGGSRQAVLDAENQRALQANLAGITGQGYANAYNQALGQFNTEQDRGMTAQDKINQYGMTGIGALADMGGVQRGIEGEGITADRLQFEEERDFPYKQVQYMQSLLQGLPLASQSVNYEQPGFLQQLSTGASDVEGFLSSLFGGEGFNKPDPVLPDANVKAGVQ